MKPVTIYTRAMCGFCWQAVSLLKNKNVNFNEINAGMNRELRAEMIQRSGGGSTFPQIFIGDQHIGGCSELMALERAGRLDDLLAA